MLGDPLDVTPAWWRKADRPTIPELSRAVRDLLKCECPLIVASCSRVLVARPVDAHPSVIDSVLRGAIKPAKGERMAFTISKFKRQRIDATPTWWGTDASGPERIGDAIARLVATGAVQSVTVHENGIHVVAMLENYYTDRDALLAAAEGAQ